MLVIRLLVTAIFLFMPHIVRAQVRVDFSPDTAECRMDARLVVNTLNSLMPNKVGNWRWIVICNPNTWSSLLRRADMVNKTDKAFTLLKDRTTFIYRDSLVDPGYRKVVAHELAHIILNDIDEGRANVLAEKLLSAKQDH